MYVAANSWEASASFQRELGSLGKASKYVSLGQFGTGQEGELAVAEAFARYMYAPACQHHGHASSRDTGIGCDTASRGRRREVSTAAGDDVRWSVLGSDGYAIEGPDRRQWQEVKDSARIL